MEIASCLLPPCFIGSFSIQQWWLPGPHRWVLKPSRPNPPNATTSKSSCHSVNFLSVFSVLILTELLYSLSDVLSWTLLCTLSLSCYFKWKHWEIIYLPLSTFYFLHVIILPLKNLLIPVVNFFFLTQLLRYFFSISNIKFCSLSLPPPLPYQAFISNVLYQVHSV